MLLHHKFKDLLSWTTLINKIPRIKALKTVIRTRMNLTTYPKMFSLITGKSLKMETLIL